MSVGERIKARRSELGWTQESLAQKAGLSKSFLSELENGKRRVSADNLLEIARTLSVSLDFLMTGTTTETAYYLLSAALSPERLNEIARHHWAVENRLHWRLDVVMNEDQDRTRLGNGPQNLAVLRHLAMNAMQKEGSKGSLRGKIQRAAWSEAYLTKILGMS